MTMMESELYIADERKKEEIDFANLQWDITRIIMQKREKFYYESIYDEIIKNLKQKGISEDLVYSFKVEGILDDALDNLVNHDVLYRFRNQYIPIRANK